MDSWFDRLAKSAGRGMSRRDSLRRLGGGLLGALGLGLAAGRAEAGKPVTTIPTFTDPADSPYFTGCQLKCSGSTGYDACVEKCVYCADPYYLRAGQTQPHAAGIVCGDTANGLYCCDAKYRTCSKAAADGGQFCSQFP